MNNNDKADKLTAEQKLAINDYVKGLISNLLKFLGFANVLAILGAIVYIYFIIPERVIEKLTPKIENAAIDELDKRSPQLKAMINSLYEVVSDTVELSGEAKGRLDSSKSDIDAIKVSNRKINEKQKFLTEEQMSISEEQRSLSEEQTSLFKEQKSLSDEINKAKEDLNKYQETIQYIKDPYTKEIIDIIKSLQDKGELEKFVEEAKKYNEEVKENSKKIADLGQMEQWQLAELKNGWKKFGDGYGSPRYFKDNFKVVHLSGVVKDGDKETIFKLPSGCRPGNKETHIVYAEGTTKGRIVIEPDGDVKVASGGRGKLSLDGVTFRAAK